MHKFENVKEILVKEIAKKFKYRDIYKSNRKNNKHITQKLLTLSPCDFYCYA